MQDSISETVLGPIEWSDWQDHPRMLVKYRSGVFRQLAPRYYATSVSLDYHSCLKDGPEIIEQRHAFQREVAVLSLVNQVNHDWNAEVSDEPVEFATGAGISSGTSMFFNRPVIEYPNEDEE